MPLTLRYTARSDVGLIREGNEDSGYAGPFLLVVADGMGGHAAGEVASAAAVDVLSHVHPPDADEDPVSLLADAIDRANSRIRDLIDADPSREGMGTTVTALLWTGERLTVAHIGDSRAYHLRSGKLHQITQDHTFVQALVDEGKITEDEARAHPARSLVLRALDGRGDPEPDIFAVEVQAGDRFLVCSDGLSGVVTDTTLQEVLNTESSLEATADTLVELALRGGAPDNVTVVLAEIVENDGTKPGEALVVGAADEPRDRRRRFWHMRGESAERRDEPEPDPELLRYAPRPPRRFAWLRRLVLVALLVGVAFVGGREFLNWTQTQYYVGVDSGSVAIFQGLSQSIGPLNLSELDERVEGLPVEALPPYYREQVEASISAADRADATRIVERLRQQACLTNPPVVTTPAPTPTPTPATTPGATSPAPTSATSPVPTPVPAQPVQATPRYPGLVCPEETNQ